MVLDFGILSQRHEAISTLFEKAKDIVAIILGSAHVKSICIPIADTGIATAFVVNNLLLRFIGYDRCGK